MKTIIALLVGFTICLAQGTSDEPVGSPKHKQRFYQSKHKMHSIYSYPLDGTVGPGKVVIIDSLVIPEGKALTIMAGTTLLFEPGAYIRIFGRIKGTGFFNEKKEIVFDKLPYAECYPTFDNSSDTLWNGILVDEGGSISLDDALMKNARVGIYCNKPNTSVSIVCVTFFNVLDAGLVINNKIISHNINCFTYNYVSSNYNEVSKKETEIKDTSTSSEKKRSGKSFRVALQIGGAALAAGGGLLWLYFNDQANHYAQDYASAREAGSIKNAYEKNHSASTTRNIMAAIALTGCAAFSVSFAF